MAGVSGVSGRKAVPTALRKATGRLSWKEKTQGKAVAAKEPKMRRARLDAPKWVSEKAREHWPRFAELVYSMGVLSQVDGGALEQLCEAYADFRNARAEMDKAVRTYGSLFVEHENMKTGVTSIRTHPSVAMMSDADRRVHRWMTDFGLTPSSRTRVQTIGDPTDIDDRASNYFDS
jgi:P27 family predicted phage terminase small subunit